MHTVAEAGTRRDAGRQTSSFDKSPTGSFAAGGRAQLLRRQRKLAHGEPTAAVR